MIAKRVVVVALVVVMLLSFSLVEVQAAPAEQMPYPGQFYVVKHGDTLYAIAARFGSTVWTIAQANGIMNPSYIYAGQVLLIPAFNPQPPVPQPPFPVGGPVVHIVRYGENLIGIARMYGVSSWAIAQANGLLNPNYIYAGQRLLIPTQTPMPLSPSPVMNPRPQQPWNTPFTPYNTGGMMPYGTPYGTPFGMPASY